MNQTRTQDVPTKAKTLAFEKNEFSRFFFTPYLMRTFVHPFLITSALDRFIKKQMHKKKSVATIKCVRYQWLAIYIFLQSNVLQGTCSSNYTDKLNLFIL